MTLVNVVALIPNTLIESLTDEEGTVDLPQAIRNRVQFGRPLETSTAYVETAPELH